MRARLHIFQLSRRRYHQRSTVHGSISVPRGHSDEWHCGRPYRISIDCTCGTDFESSRCFAWSATTSSWSLFSFSSAAATLALFSATLAQQFITSLVVSQQRQVLRMQEQPHTQVSTTRRVGRQTATPAIARLVSQSLAGHAMWGDARESVVQIHVLHPLRLPAKRTLRPC